MTDGQPIVIVRSSVHGLRSWRRIGSKPHTTARGRRLNVGLWEGRCTICFAPFTVTTPEAVRTKSKGFDTISCPKHRLTSVEAGQIAHTPAADRPAAFARLRQRILARKP